MTEVSRKWSATGTGLDAAESEARRLEKKGTFAATMDEEAGTVTLSKEDFKSVMGKLGTHKRTAKTAKKNVLLLAFGYLAVTIGFIAVIVGLVNWRLEATKESHVVDSTLVGRDGKSVETAQIETFAQLFDIPHFSIATLEKISKVAVVLGDNRQVSFGVTRIIKSPGSTRVQLEDANGNGLDIDACSTLALAKINGELVHVKGMATSGRNLASSAAPRLYSAQEFGALKAEQRALGEGSASIGHAIFSVKAAEAILDATEAEYPERTTTYINGETVVVGESGEVENWNVEVVTSYGSDGELFSRINYQSPEEHIILDGLRSTFYTLEAGKVVKCGSMENTETLTPPAFLDVQSCNDDGYVVKAAQEDGRTAYFRTNVINYHGSLDMIAVPKPDECILSDHMDVWSEVFYSPNTSDVPESKYGAECMEGEECDEPEEFRLAKEAGRDVAADRELYAQEQHGELTTDTFGFSGYERGLLRRAEWGRPGDSPGPPGGGGGAPGAAANPDNKMPGASFWRSYSAMSYNHNYANWWTWKGHNFLRGVRDQGYYYPEYETPKRYWPDNGKTVVGLPEGRQAGVNSFDLETFGRAEYGGNNAFTHGYHHLNNLNRSNERYGGRYSINRNFDNGYNHPHSGASVGFRYPSELSVLALYAYYGSDSSGKNTVMLEDHLRIWQTPDLFAAGNWSCWKRCEFGLSSTGWFFYKYPTMAFAFTGSDNKLLDFMLAIMTYSWLNRIPGPEQVQLFVRELIVAGLADLLLLCDHVMAGTGQSFATEGFTGKAKWNGKSHTIGTILYVVQIIPCILEGVVYLGRLNPAVYVDYWVGHSLGGAAATVMGGSIASTFGVVTFAAFPTAYGRRCSTTGIRIAHADDPIGGWGNIIRWVDENHDARFVYIFSQGCKTVIATNIRYKCKPKWINKSGYGDCNHKTGRKNKSWAKYIMKLIKFFEKLLRIYNILLECYMYGIKEYLKQKIKAAITKIVEKWLCIWEKIKGFMSRAVIPSTTDGGGGPGFFVNVRAKIIKGWETAWAFKFDFPQFFKSAAKWFAKIGADCLLDFVGASIHHSMVLYCAYVRHPKFNGTSTKGLIKKSWLGWFTRIMSHNYARNDSKYGYTSMGYRSTSLGHNDY